MTGYAVILIALIFAKESIADNRVYPGTASRPILSDDEAAKYTESNYFSGWEPEAIVIPTEPDYTVKAGDSIQAVVNEAIKNGSPSYRTTIKIEPGRYMETVYIKGDIPLTIYGSGATAADVHIMATLSANTKTSEYKNIVNTDGQHYQEGDPAWSLYNTCANKDDVIGVECSAVFWIESDQLQLQGVTVHNGGLDAKAVAVKTSADRLHIMGNNILGVQGTVGLGIEEGENAEIQRVLLHMNYIEGETDYIFGGATVVLKMDTLNTIAKVESNDLAIFAPDTSPDRSYGFLVINGNITGDESYLNSNKVKLGRSWDYGVQSASDYVAGESPNGQLVIRDTLIAKVIDVDAPYAAADSSNRPFSTNIKTGRDLDDNSHNRLWEYNNKGDGA